ncbi:MAG: histidine kinase [Nocardioidaceae bacterium]
MKRDERAPEAHVASVSLALPAVWLLFLIVPASRNWDHRTEPRVLLGYAAMLLLAVVYLGAFQLLRAYRDQLETELPRNLARTLVAGMIALVCVMEWSLGQSASGGLIYAAVAAAMLLPSLEALGVAVVLAAGSFIASVEVHGWSRDWMTPALLLCAGFVMWGIRQLLNRNVDLVARRARTEEVLLQQERNRFAQDLHDILGHSLTVITVKAELANRLFDVDLDRARAEVEDLERLARDALADVRRAVHGYKDLSLTSEIAHARRALESAGIEAILPKFVDHVDGDLRDLFAWTIREGVTNVVRHSAATSCTVELYPDRVVVSDDGRGDEGEDSIAARGHGLSGLSDRAAQVGASVQTRTLSPTGFILEVVRKAAR